MGNQLRLRNGPQNLPFGEITQNKGQYAFQFYLRSRILAPIESTYDFLLVITQNIKTQNQSIANS